MAGTKKTNKTVDTSTLAGIAKASGRKKSAVNSDRNYDDSTNPAIRNPVSTTPQDTNGTTDPKITSPKQMNPQHPLVLRQD